MNKITLSILLAIFLLPLSGFGQTITLSVEGTKQGKFKGESMKGKFADKSELAGYQLEITSPRDAASGQATGRRTFQPVILLKATGASSPQFLQALSTNELLKKVVIDFYRPDPSGMEVNYYTVTLENVSISGYKQFIGPLENEKFNPVNTILYDEIKLLYQRITVEDKVSKTMATDENAGGRSFQ
ncbi:MAG: type VI secretion system tube protein Hcp [Sphingobacteriales bacterium]|nr:type VI secretion system tube protein Hcp [Sphingobacteriales bacterium]